MNRVPLDVYMPDRPLDPPDDEIDYTEDEDEAYERWRQQQIDDEMERQDADRTDR